MQRKGHCIMDSKVNDNDEECIPFLPMRRDSSMPHSAWSNPSPLNSSKSDKSRPAAAAPSVAFGPVIALGSTQLCARCRIHSCGHVDTATY